MSNENQIMKKPNFLMNPILLLVILGICGLTIRIIFLKWDIPFEADNLLYFQYAIDLTLEQKFPAMPEVGNNGWPIFLSLFFGSMNSSNFLDYMNMQRIISVIISTITIIPIYLLTKQFLEKKYAIITCGLFVFEPRLIQNSIFGISDALYIFVITFGMYFLLNKNSKFTIIAFMLIACASIIRVEAILLLPAFSIIFFYKYHKRKNLIQFIFLIGIFLIITVPVAELRTEAIGHDNLSNKILIGTKTIFQDDDHNIFANSFFTATKFFGLSLIPLFFLFVPLGLFMILKNRQTNYWSLLILGIFMIIPIAYAYSRNYLDVRYIFPLYPFYCIIGTLPIIYIIEKTQFKKSFVVGIFILIILTSILFLSYQENQNSDEVMQLALIVHEKTGTIFQYSPESGYINSVNYLKDKNFPKLSSNYKNQENIQISLRGIQFNSMGDYITYGKDKGLSHIVIDDRSNRPDSFKDVFFNENKYSYLKKIYDSKSDGFTYHVKVFEINYELFDSIVNKKQ